ncbi:hypothetical protein Asal01_00126 [Fodinibius salicampi]
MKEILRTGIDFLEAVLSTIFLGENPEDNNKDRS